MAQFLKSFKMIIQELTVIQNNHSQRIRTLLKNYNYHFLSLLNCKQFW